MGQFSIDVSRHVAETQNPQVPMPPTPAFLTPYLHTCSIRVCRVASGPRKPQPRTVYGGWPGWGQGQLSEPPSMSPTPPRPITHTLTSSRAPIMASRTTWMGLGLQLSGSLSSQACSHCLASLAPSHHTSSRDCSIASK